MDGGSSPDPEVPEPEESTTAKDTVHSPEPETDKELLAAPAIPVAEQTEGHRPDVSTVDGAVSAGEAEGRDVEELPEDRVRIGSEDMSEGEPDVSRMRGVLDQYGFAVPAQYVTRYREQTELQATRRDAIRAQWKVLLSEVGEKPKDVRKLLRGAVVSGVTAEYRPVVWPLLCGVPTYQKQKPGLFQRLIKRAEHEERHAQISLDLDRTFPGHPLLDTQEGMASLERVLTAFALYDPHVGYCQSTNFMVGLLLIMDVTEEEAFWILVHISRVILPEYFAPPMLGTSIDHEVFKELLNARMPEVVQLLDKMRLDVAILCAQWFLCLFSNRMPCETVCRIWDYIFCRGPPAMFQVALAVIKQLEPRLLACEEMGEVMELLRETELSLFDADTLLETAVCEFTEVMEVSTLRAAVRPKVVQQYTEWQARARPSAATSASAMAVNLKMQASQAMDRTFFSLKDSIASLKLNERA